MKKYVVFLLCLIMILSLFSCEINESQDDLSSNKNSGSTDVNDDSTNDSSIAPDASDDSITNTTNANYDSVLEVYRLIVEKFPIVNQNPRAVAAELGIQDEAEIEAFVNLYSSIHLFYPGDSVSPHHKLGCGYSVKDLNGDGVDELVLMNKDYYIMAIFSFANEKPRLLGYYWDRNSCWIDGDGLLHENGSSGADRSTNAVYKIADGGKELELIVEYGTNGHEWIADVAYTKYYKLANGEKKTITEAEYQALDKQYSKYLGSVAGAEATKKHSGLTFTSLYTEAEIAMEMYEAALKNEIKVYGTDIKEYNYLKDCKTPYSRIPLCELESIGYVYMDVDGDLTNELVIDCGDTLVLRYYEGCVYVYPFTFRGINNLHTDGSYSWNNTGMNFEYGEKRLAFDGAELNSKELWRIVNDGEPNAEYYIDGKQVTQEEILKYFEDNPKTKVEFSPLEVSWINKISGYKALTLAKEYWEDFDIEENGYIVERGTNGRAPSSVYVFVIRRYVIDHYSTFDEIWINKTTGEAIIPYTPDAKG